MSGIVVGVDGSGHSQRALEWAVREAALRHAPLTVLAVHQALTSSWSGRPADFPGDQPATERTRELAQAEADKAVEATGAQPADVIVRAVNGLPAQELLSASEGADMLVIGSRGTGGFTRLLMGSVSSQVTHHAKCPVVVIPADNRH